MASETPPAWERDEARQKWYYWSGHESCFIYEHGLKLSSDGTEIASATAPSTDPNATNQTNVPTGISRQDNIAPPTNEQPPLRGNGGSQICTQITIRGTEGDIERLDPRFRKRDPRYFQVGAVFKILWAEPASEMATMSAATNPEYLEKDGQKFYVQYRYFVVVKRGDTSSICLRIQSFGMRGVANKRNKGDFAIIYTREYPPEPSPAERPLPGEEPMGEPIKVTVHDDRNKLSDKSRLSFAKPYTVEHNVKVLPVGNVHPHHFSILTGQFERAMRSTPGPNFHSSWNQAPARPAPSSGGGQRGGGPHDEAMLTDLMRRSTTLGEPTQQPAIPGSRGQNPAGTTRISSMGLSNSQPTYPYHGNQSTYPYTDRQDQSSTGYQRGETRQQPSYTTQNSAYTTQPAGHSAQSTPYPSYPPGATSYASQPAESQPRTYSSPAGGHPSQATGYPLQTTVYPSQTTGYTSPPTRSQPPPTIRYTQRPVTGYPQQPRRRDEGDGNG